MKNQSTLETDLRSVNTVIIANDVFFTLTNLKKAAPGEPNSNVEN